MIDLKAIFDEAVTYLKSLIPGASMEAAAAIEQFLLNGAARLNALQSDELTEEDRKSALEDEGSIMISQLEAIAEIGQGLSEEARKTLIAQITAKILEIIAGLIVNK